MSHFENEGVPLEEKQQTANPLWSALGWVLLMLTVYLLSSGPAMLHQRILSQFFYEFYSPVWQLYWSTPLKKPIGMYWHLWNPDVFDKDGKFHLYVVPD